MSLSAAFALWGRSRDTWRLGPGVTEGKTSGGCIMWLAWQRDPFFKQTGSFLEPGWPLSLWAYWSIVPLPIGWIFKIPTVSCVCPVDFLLYFAWSETVLSTTLVSSRLCLLSSDATKCRLWDVTPSNAETENVVVCFNRFACVLPQCYRSCNFVEEEWGLSRWYESLSCSQSSYWNSLLMNFFVAVLQSCSPCHKQWCIGGDAAETHSLAQGRFWGSDVLQM